MDKGKDPVIECVVFNNRVSVHKSLNGVHKNERLNEEVLLTLQYKL